MNEIMTRRGMKIGLLFGGVVVVMTFIGGLINAFIPFLVCFTWIFLGLGWLVLLIGGNANGYAEGFTKDNMANIVKKSIGAGIWAAIIMGTVGGVLAVILSLIPKTVSYLGYSYTYSDFTIMGSILTVLGQIVGSLLSAMFWFIVGGFIAAYLPKSALPVMIGNFYDKVKAFTDK